MLRRRTHARTGISGAVLLLLLLGVLLGGSSVRVMAVPPGQSPDEGEALFQEKCAACHTVGQGDLLGPDLKGVTTRRDHGWLTRWLLAPDQVLAQQDPIAVQLLANYNNLPMPNLGLTETEAAALIAYLEVEAEGIPAQGTTGASTAALSAGDPASGKSLFTGTTRFQSGGPACRACHSIAGIGALGGGALGPDLTGAHAELGDAMITWPESVAPMRAIYSAKPLTPEEKAHLLAFLQSALVAQRPPQAVGQLTGLAVAGVAVVLIAAAIIWRRRLSNVRRPMVTGQGRRST